jgi:hypothetical protein
MNDRDQARDWDEAARHLVRAHGADPGRLLSLGLHLNHLNWVHFDTHAALEIAGLQPPLGHVHGELPDPDLDAPDHSVRPLPRAPSALSPAASDYARLFASYEYTGLPQTGLCPRYDAGDVTGRWASMAVDALGQHFAAGCPETDYAVVHSRAALAVREHFAARGQPEVTADEAIAEFRDGIRRCAEAVSLRRQTSADFPAGPLAGGPAARTDRDASEPRSARARHAQGRGQ